MHHLVALGMTSWPVRYASDIVLFVRQLRPPPKHTHALVQCSLKPPALGKREANTAAVFLQTVENFATPRCVQTSHRTCRLSPSCCSPFCGALTCTVHHYRPLLLLHKISEEVSEACGESTSVQTASFTIYEIQVTCRPPMLFLM